MPAETRAPNNYSQHSTTSRLETRLRTDSTASAAWKRGPIAPTLKLSNPLILLANALLQPLYLLVHAQQHRDDHVLTLALDRRRLNPLHTERFAATPLCPPTH